MLRASDFLVGKMREAGLTAERIDTAGHPLVYGEWLGAPGKPTVLFYGHYDVQPVDPIELWRNPPFEPTVEGDKLVARGATDDKGQSYAHLKGVAAMLAERGSAAGQRQVPGRGRGGGGRRGDRRATSARTAASGSPPTASSSPTPRSSRPASRR